MMNIAKTRRQHIETANITTGHPDTILPEQENNDEITRQTTKKLDSIGNDNELVWKRKHESQEITHPAENIK